jgi:uncharacterized protein YkwD
VSSDPSLEAAILGEVNALRRAHGVAPLRPSRALGAAATAHSRAMVTFGFFRHESRDGGAFSARLGRFYRPTGSGTWSVGENLLWSTPGLDARGAVRLWLDSPPHRRNLLSPRWREIGLSAMLSPAAPGVFGGRDVVVVTSDFGVRS